MKSNNRIFGTSLLLAAILLSVTGIVKYTGQVSSNGRPEIIADGAPRPPLPPVTLKDGAPRPPLPPVTLKDGAPRPPLPPAA